MSSETLQFERSGAPGSIRARRRRTIASSSLVAHGEPMVWLTAGAMVIALLMIVGLLAFIAVRGTATFWPVPVLLLETTDGHHYLGEVYATETFIPPTESASDTASESSEQAEPHTRRLLRTGNFELSGTHFTWVDDGTVTSESKPEWAMVVERTESGRFYGILDALVIDGEPITADPQDVWRRFGQLHEAARDRRRQAVALSKRDLDAVNRRKERARLAVVGAELDGGSGSEDHQAAQAELREVEDWELGENARIVAEIRALEDENRRFSIRLKTADDQRVVLSLDQIVRAYPANQLGWSGRAGVYVSRWWEFLSEEPREANSEGGILPAIWGTVAMTLVMSLAVVPFGVLAAIYLHEYARRGAIVSILRIAINNLAGVPSIVFGVFGLGFFCYVVGAQVDQLFFRASLAENTPTFGTGGLLWASLTLALLTLPVVIVSTEEALAAVPNSMREGSYALGAGKWQTIRRIVLPKALPGVMTGMILAMARGAGEVAPLMLVGVMKEAPELPVDRVFPFVHPERSFMHLGYQVYDMAFHSQNSDAAIPLVFSTALVLIAIITVLNVAAIWLRGRLRRRYMGSAV